MNKKGILFLSFMFVLVVLYLCTMFRLFPFEISENSMQISATKKLEPKVNLKIVPSDEDGKNRFIHPEKISLEDSFDNSLIDTVLDEEGVPYNEPHILPAMRGNMEVVNKLRKEDLNESMENLSQVGMFYSVGSTYIDSSNIISRPLPKGYGASDVEVIMSNRRFLKLYSEIGSLSEKQASECVEQYLQSAFRDYCVKFNEYIETTFKPYGSVSSQLSDNADGSPTLMGLRYEIFSLLLISGNLRLKQTHTLVNDISDYATNQRDHFYVEGSEENYKKLSLLMHLGIYNRQILSTALIGTSGSSEDWSQESRWNIKEITRYDAAFTAHDDFVRRRIVPADFRSGVQNIKVHIPLTDQEFEEIHLKK